MPDVVYKPLNDAKSDNYPVEPTKSNWEYLLLTQGKLIHRHGYAFDGSENEIYTVPSGKLFFLISAGLVVETQTDDDAKEGFVLIKESLVSTIATSTQALLAARCGGVPTGTPDTDELAVNVTISPTLPIKLVAGQYISVYALTSTLNRCQGYISGYEIQASVFYSSN